MRVLVVAILTVCSCGQLPRSETLGYTRNRQETYRASRVEDLAEGLSGRYGGEGTGGAAIVGE